MTATSSTAYNNNNNSSPPSPSSSSSIPAATDGLESLSLSSSTSRPIPIPKPSSTSTAAHDHHLPVTPLTGRFDKGYYYFQPTTNSHKSSSHKKHHRHGHHRRPHHSHHRHPASSMRSDSSNLYSSVVSPNMPSSGRASSPQPSRSRPQTSSKSVPGFHLSNLPRFHPAVYQPSGGSQATAGQPQPPTQSRQHTYRQSSGSSSRDGMWQYGGLVDSVTASRASGQPSPSPSAPRLDPLNSPGPVTPLVLEDANSYLASGTASAADSRNPSNPGPAPDMVERLLAREGERSRQQGSRISAKGR